MANTVQRKQLGHWTEKVFRITSDCPLAGLRADSKISDGSVRKKVRSLPDGVAHVCFHWKDPNDMSRGYCGHTWNTKPKKTKHQDKRKAMGT